MKDNFKIGDKVAIVNPDHFQGIEEENVWEVVAIQNDFTIVIVNIVDRKAAEMRGGIVASAPVDVSMVRKIKSRK